MEDKVDWKIVQIQDIAQVIRGASPRPKGDKRYYGGNVPRLMVEDVTRDGKYVYPSVDFLTEEGAKLSRPCTAGTLTIVCSGTVGVPSILGVDACIHDGFLGLVKVSPKVSVDYLYHFFCTQREKFNNSATHGGVFTNLTTDGVKAFEVKLPIDLAEQEKIATALSDTDALISELEKLIEKKQAIKTATMQQLLTGKTRLPEFALREDGMPKAYKESELGPIPEDWSVMQLDQICDVVDPHPSHRAPPEVSNGIPFLGIGDFDTDGNIIKSKLRLVDKSIYDEHSKRYDLNKNLLGLGRVASIGKVIRLKNGMGKYTISPTLGILQSNSVDTDFLYYFLQSNKVSEQFSKVMSGSTRSSVGMIVLRQLNIIVPSTNESYCIGQLLKAIEDDIRSVSEKINKLKALKQGMMQELLTGKTRLV